MFVKRNTMKKSILMARNYQLRTLSIKLSVSDL